jgi:hypothetical protein
MSGTSPEPDPVTENRVSPEVKSRGPETNGNDPNETIRLSPILIVLGILAVAIGLGAGLVMSSLAQR